MGAVGALSGGIPERVDKQAWKIIEIKRARSLSEAGPHFGFGNVSIAVV